MIKKMLQESAKLFDEAAEARKSTEMPSSLMYKNNWKGFKKAIDEYDPKIMNLEKQHQANIKKLSSNALLVKQLLPFIENKDHTIRREALFVIVESKDNKMIQQMLQATLSFSTVECAAFYERLGFVSEEAFRIVFECAEKIGFDQPQNNYNMAKALLNYITHFHLIDLTKKFTKLEKFPKILQYDIIEMLSFFEEYREFILDTYINNHSYYSYYSSPGTDAFKMLMLCREEKTALKVLRQKDVLVGEYSSVGYLTELGDKSDGSLMGKMLRKAFLSGEWNKQEFSYRSQWLHDKLDEAYDISNPFLIEEMIPLFKEIYKDAVSDDEDISMYGGEIYDLLNSMLIAQFGELDQEYCAKLDQKLPREDLVYQCWKDHSKSDMRRKFLRGSEAYSVQLYLLVTLINGIQTLTYPFDLQKFRTITGAGDEYLFNRSTYYSTTKAQVEKWLHYIESNKKNYEAGRWIRFGRYVDVPYTPIGSDDLKKDTLPKDFLKE